MRRSGFGRRAASGLTTAAAVVGILLASVVGLDAWADSVATHVPSVNRSATGPIS